MKTLLGTLIPRLVLLLRSVGPYAAIELLLPGGSMVALLYWWYRHRVRRTRDGHNAVRGQRLRSAVNFWLASTTESGSIGTAV
jgi:hypothetical protein